MPKRTVKFVSAIFTGILASAPLAIPAHGETAPPDGCLTSPKGEAPSGTHWYYRIEHGTKRHCWYTRDQGEKQSQTAPQNISPAARVPVPAANPAPQRSPVDARAELSSQPGRDDALLVVPPSAAARSNDDAQPDGSAAAASSGTLASRWPDRLAGIPQLAAQPANGNPAADAPADTAASPEPVDATVIPADADSTSQGERGLMPLLVAILGAFALGAAIIVRFGHPRMLRPRTVRAHRGPIWETTDDDRIVLSEQPMPTNAYTRRPRFARGPAEADEQRTMDTYRPKPRRAHA
jgi:hypothetical protein